MAIRVSKLRYRLPFSASFSSSTNNIHSIPSLLTTSSCSHPHHYHHHTPLCSHSSYSTKTQSPFRPVHGVNSSEGVLSELFVKNREWATKNIDKDKNFFSRLVAVQRPKYLWIGCSDSRVPANEIVGLLPGELFVHRNVAGLVLHTDWNCLAVVQFAIEYLKVEHILICGHYNCGGIAAAIDGRQYGLIDHWLRHVKDLYETNISEFKNLNDIPTKVNLLCELSVRQQVRNLCQTSVVQNAWKRQQKLGIHGMIYDLKDGLLKDLEVYVDGVNRVTP